MPAERFPFSLHPPPQVKEVSDGQSHGISDPNGAWVDPVVKKSTPVINPATEEAMYEVALGSKADADKAVAAAKRAFTTLFTDLGADRIALLEDHRGI